MIPQFIKRIFAHRHTWKPTTFFLNVHTDGRVQLATNWTCVSCHNQYAIGQRVESEIFEENPHVGISGGTMYIIDFFNIKRPPEVVRL